MALPRKAKVLLALLPLALILVFGGYEVSNPDLLTERAVHGFLRGPTMHTDALGAGLALAADDPREALARVRCPVLVLWGARASVVKWHDIFGVWLGTSAAARLVVATDARRRRRRKPGRNCVPSRPNHR